MAKIVIAGSADCPHFARVELLADDLAKNLPNFELHKIVTPSTEWPEWSRHCCRDKGWRQQRSPIIWRELVNQGGKGVLIGGANEFQEFAKAYYDIESSMLSPEMLSVAKDNSRYKAELDAEVAHLRSLSKPLEILITSAASQAAYQLLPLLMDGTVFGRDTELAFTLFDCSVTDVCELEGISMEAFDSACPLVRRVAATTDFISSAARADVLLLLDELLMKPTEQPPQQQQPPKPQQQQQPADSAAAEAPDLVERADWLGQNASLYRRYADWLSAAAATTTSPDCGGRCDLRRLKVLLTGRGPVNFGARVLLEACRGLAPANVAASARLLERQAKGTLAGHLKVPPSSVPDLIVWGDPAGQNVVDLAMARVHHYDGAITGADSYSQPALETVWDRKWLGQEFPKIVEQRQRRNVRGEVARGAALSSAQATADTVRDWWLGCRGNEMHSFGVASEGWYGVPRGLVFSFPVRYHPKGAWSVVEDFDMTEEAAQKLREVAQAAQRDYELVFPPPAPPADAAADDPSAVDTGEIEIGGVAAGADANSDDAADGGVSAGAPASELAVNIPRIEHLRDRLDSLKLPPLTADALVRLTPGDVEELLTIVGTEELKLRIQRIEESRLTTVQEAEDEATAAASAGRAGTTVEEESGDEEADGEDEDADD